MTASLRVLYIDDDPVDRDQVQRDLVRAFPRVRIDWISDADAQVRALDAGAFDVVVTDFVLGWTNGLSILREVKIRYPECPVIMFTAGGNEAVAVEGMKSGLDDYVIRSPAHRARLVTAVQAAMDRARSRAAAREAEARYRNLFEGVPVGLFRSTPDGKLVDINPALRQMLALPPAGSFGEIDLPARFVDPADAGRWRTQIATDGVVQGFETRLRRMDDVAIWVRGSARAVLGPDGRVQSCEGQMEDVTERREGEEALRKTTERLSLVIEAAGLGIWEYNFVSDSYRDSETAERMLGVPSGRAVQSGNEFIRLLHPDDREKVWADMNRAIETGSLYRSEFRVVWPDGRERWIMGIGRILRDDGGRPLRVVGINLDVTERRRTEEAIRTSEEKYRRLVETANDAILVADAETASLIDANRKAVELIGRPKEQIVGMPMSEIHPPEERERAGRRFAEAAREESGFVATDHTLLGKGGRRVPVEISTSVVKAGGRRIVQGIFRDLSERRELEEQLRHAQRLDAVGRLAGGVAHDFNNLLAAIVGFAQLGRQQVEPSSSVRRYLEEVLKAADRAEAITRQLLAFSRRQSLKPTTFDLNAVVSGLAPMVRRLAGDRIAVRTDLGTGAGPVRADVGQVEQVLLNLAVNARDAMPEGGTLTIESGAAVLDAEAAGQIPAGQPGDYVFLRVGDSGCGMDAETRAHIFEPFFTTKEHGTGLGLAMAYGIVRQSGGFVEVESEPGRGSRFTVYLPHAAEAEAKRASSTFPAVVPGGTETILLVEDDGAVRAMVRETLQIKGYTVLEAADAEAALSAVGRHGRPVSLLLADVGLPGLSGPELARRLAERMPGLRAIFLSGYTDEHVGAESAAPGRLLRKPFAPDALARRVREALDGDPPEKP